MAIYVPPGFGGEEEVERPSPKSVVDPLVVLDTVFMRHGDQVESKVGDLQKDELSTLGREQAVVFGKVLGEQDGVFGYCGNTRIAEDYLKLVLENRPNSKKSRIRFQNSLNSIDASLTRGPYNKQRQEQVEELAFLIEHYQKLARWIKQRTRITILFVTHTLVSEALLERIITDKNPPSPLFDPTSVVHVFAPGDFWTLRTAISTGSPEKRVILLKRKEYMLRQNVLDNLSSAFSVRKKALAERPRETPNIPTSLHLQFSCSYNQIPEIALKRSVASTNEYQKEAYKNEAFHEYLQFLFHQSDKLAEKLNDQEASTYSRQAANVAQLIKQRYQDFIQNVISKGKIKESLPAHLGVVESFLMKYLSKMKGQKKHPSVEQIINLLEKGFDSGEGLEIEITKNTEPRIVLHFHKKNDATGKKVDLDEEIPLEILDQIIQERPRGES